MPQVQIKLSEETYKAIKRLNIEDGGNVRAFVVAATEKAVAERLAATPDASASPRAEAEE